MELILKDTKLNLAEGIDANKFGANRAIATNPKEVKDLFTNHGYNLNEVSGIFVKAFNLNAQELKEVATNLDKIDELGMREVFSSNLKIKYFRDKFLKRLVWCINHGVPYLNEDGTFAAYFDDDEAYEKFIANVPETRQEHSYELDEENTALNEMSTEDKQVYNEVVEKLNYLVLGNTMDTNLAAVVSNITNKIVAPILRKEYRYIPLAEIIDNIMFEGMDVAVEDNERIQEMILGAFREDERKVA